LKRKAFILFIFSLLCSVSYSQQGIIKIQGKIIGRENYKPVKRANVINKRQKKIVVTDTLGNFSIDALKGDTLHFSALGFQNKTIYVNDSLLPHSKSVLVSLSLRKYQLKEVTIEGFGEYSDFKQKFTDLKIKPDSVKLGLPVIKGSPTILSDKNPKSVGYAVLHPVTFLYSAFSKEEKSKRKVYELEKQDKIQDLADKKYNKQKLANWTGLKDEELTNFYLFCNFTKEYVVQNSELDIMIKVNENLKIFKREHPASKN
jgi:hypothetical protein